MASPTSHRALHTVEILEIILVEADLRTVFLSQRVSKIFRAVIASSTKLQKKLFFTRPTLDEAIRLNTDGEEAIVLSERPNQAVIINPLIFALARDYHGSHSRKQARFSEGILRDMQQAKGGHGREVGLMDAHVRSQPSRHTLYTRLRRL